MEQSPSSVANSHSTSQEIPCTLRNPKVHYRVHNSRSIPRPSVTFRNNMSLYGEELLGPRQTLKLEDHTPSGVRDCLLNIFTATLHIWRPPSTT